MLKSYGINRGAHVESDMDLHIEEFNILGYTVIEDVLPADQLAVLRDELQRVYASQEATFTKERIKSINEEYLARAVLCFSEAYLDLARNEVMMPYVKRLLGNYFLLHLQNGIINMPQEEHHQSSWHRDLPYQNWVSSEPIGVNVFYCLDEFSAATGGTIILPYSHKVDHAPSEQYMTKHALQVEARAGSVLLFDSMLFHKAGYNSSGNIRRGVNHLYARSIVRQQISLPDILQGKYSDDPFLNMLLGYDAQSALSVDAFRERRFKKNQKSY